MNQKRIRDYGIRIGGMETGSKNSITDVEGVTVGHCTIDNPRSKTGVTAIMPSRDNIFKNKFAAACHVINGFGKSIGTVQIEELGTIETPIILTNTLSVGIAADALVQYMLDNNDDIGLKTGTVNPVVCECNDGYLNNIREGNVKREHVLKAIENAGTEFEEGAVGGGTGMRCFGLKGGIGSASRIIEFDKRQYNLGTLVMSNFGGINDLNINGINVGRAIVKENNKKIPECKENGSIVTIIATDVPLSARQLKRVAKRATVGINRTGGFIGNCSGEVVIAFSTANIMKHYLNNDIINLNVLHEDKINTVFRAASESVEEAILNSLVCSKTTVGRDGHIVYSLSGYMDILNINSMRGAE